MIGAEYSSTYDRSFRQGARSARPLGYDGLVPRKHEGLTGPPRAVLLASDDRRNTRQCEFMVGTVSWIDDRPNPMVISAQAEMLSPDWIPKTYLGLAATSNPAPPTFLPDFRAYQGAKNFRSMTFCRFRVAFDDATRKVSNFQVLDAFHDGGWTPAFRMRYWPATIVLFRRSIYSLTAHQGEYSPLSVVNTQSRHRNSAIVTVPANEIVLVNALIKFRAGKHTDDIAIREVGSPYHVPWVWCEMVLTYVDGRFKVYGRGSIYPSHAWYFNGSRIQTQAQVGDDNFPLKPLASFPIPGPPTIPVLDVPTMVINEYGLRIYPVLTRGAPASGSQVSLSDDNGRAGPVDNHPYTVAGGGTWTRMV